MTDNRNNYLHTELTRKIIGSAYEVYHRLGAGFLEKIYENALTIQLKKQGLKVLQQHPISVYYDDMLVGEYFADLLVEDKVIVELKAVSELAKAHAIGKLPKGNRARGRFIN